MREPFGTTAGGAKVERLTLDDGTLSVRVLTLGAILNDVRLAGVAHGLTLGTGSLAPYEGPMGYYGALVGPCANRIAGARAEIDGRRCDFDPNDHGKHTLHGGRQGTHAHLWRVTDQGDTALTLALDLADGVGGFPGNRQIRARFALTGAGGLDLTVEAETDAPSLVNIANHSYWNLDGTRSYAGHRLKIAADRYLPITDETLPTGEIAPVAGTPMDFRDGQRLEPGKTPTIDHNFCLGDGRVARRPVLELTGTSGVRMTIETTEPGLQVFDGHKDDAAGIAGHDGTDLGAFSGLALEAQGWPDAPHHPDFPSVLLRPGEVYRQATRFDFAAPGA